MQVGDTVRLLRAVEARYSGYAGRRKMVVPKGAVCRIIGGPNPSVMTPLRWFYTAECAGYPEGLALWVGDARKLRKGETV